MHHLLHRILGKDLFKVFPDRTVAHHQGGLFARQLFDAPEGLGLCVGQVVQHDHVQAAFQYAQRGMGAYEACSPRQQNRHDSIPP